MRVYKDWLKAFVEYASYGEAPRRMYFWVGVSTLAGALRRRVWVDQVYFRWYPNFYIIIVAPPGIVSKSTTADIGMRLLRRVPGVNFGPDVVTWQALVGAFAGSTESFEYNGEFYPMSALTIEASELGNLLNPQDREMVDLLVTLWDGKQGAFTKVTKMSGNDAVENPWTNIIACTTPSWIAGNVPEYMIGGGFTSRCIFVYADQKERLVPYLRKKVPANIHEVGDKLVSDLEHISMTLVGNYELTPEAYDWGEKWYEEHYKNRPAHLDDDRFGGYIARKQTHIHKLAIVLSASCRDETVITKDDLCLANTMVTDLELDMPKVFSKIGRTDVSNNADRLIAFVRRNGQVPYESAYRYVHNYFPDLKDFEGVLSGALRAGLLQMCSVKGADGTDKFVLRCPDAGV